MALQTSIDNYFYSRKRHATDDPLGKSVTNKVLILEKDVDNEGTTSDKPAENQERVVLYADSPKSSTSKSETAPKLLRKTPRTATRSSARKERLKSDRQSDIRKSLLPSFQLEQELNQRQDNDVPENNVKVPFDVRGLTSPNKEVRKAVTEESKPSISTAPTESSCQSLKKELGLSDIKKKLLGSSRIAELRNKLKKLNEGQEKLKEIEDKKTLLQKSPSLKKFNSIEVEILTSPSKNVMEEVKQLKSPSLLRSAAFKSPSKYAPGQMPYVSPRKLFQSPPQTEVKSPMKSPTFQRYYNLANSGKPTLILPYKYRCLAEIFRAVDTVVSILFNRKESIIFEKLKHSVQQMCKKTLTENMLAQIIHVRPNLYIFTREKRKTIGKQPDKYDLVVKPILERDENNKNEDNLLTPTLLVKRLRDFYNNLLDIAKDHHEVFLKSLRHPINIPKEKLTRWHPEFDVDACPDLGLASLPPAPDQEKCSTARDILLKAKDMLGANNRVEKALERLSEKKDIFVGSTPASQAIPALTNALKGIPKSLLEKVRARQAAKTAELLMRPPEETQRRLELTRLPEMARILRNMFVLERKYIMASHKVIDKIKISHRDIMTDIELNKHLKLLSESVPDWIQLYTIDGDHYVKLAKDDDMNKVMDRLQELIDKNQMNL